MELHQLLVSNWSLLFEITKVKRTGKSLTTFSELTETYLLPTSASSHGIQSALLATFRHLLIDTNVLNIELILKLFMDFLASNFGQISLYSSVQSILENLLEAYFHRLYVVRRYSDTLSSASQDLMLKNGHDLPSKSTNNNDSLGSTSSGDGTASAGGGMRLNDSIQSEVKGSSTPITSTANNDSLMRKHPQNLFSSSVNIEALKMLTRIYLSSLKACTMDFQPKANSDKTTYMKYVKFMKENFNKVYSHHISQNTNSVDDGKNSPIDESKFFTDTTCQANESNGQMEQLEIPLTKIPVLFLLQRPSFLNEMPPISDIEAIKGSEQAQNAGIRCGDEQGRKAIAIVLKLQVGFLNQSRKK